MAEEIGEIVERFCTATSIIDAESDWNSVGSEERDYESSLSFDVLTDAADDNSTVQEQTSDDNDEDDGVEEREVDERDRWVHQFSPLSSPQQQQKLSVKKVICALSTVVSVEVDGRSIALIMGNRQAHKIEIVLRKKFYDGQAGRKSCATSRPVVVKYRCVNCAVQIQFVKENDFQASFAYECDKCHIRYRTLDQCTPCKKETNGNNRSQSSCSICGVQTFVAWGGISSCLECASFFERCSEDRLDLECVTGERNCEVKKYYQNYCSFCRLQKCLDVGMSFGIV